MSETPGSTVLFVDTGPWSGGAQRSLFALANGLRDKGFRPYVLGADATPGGLLATCAAAGLPCARLPVRHGSRTPQGLASAAIDLARAWPALRRAVRDTRPVLIHANGTRAALLAGWLPGRRVPLVVHARDVLEPEWLRRLAVRRAAGVIAISRFVADAWVHALRPGTTLAVIPNGLDTEAIGRTVRTPAWPWRAEQWTAVLVADFAAWKRHDLFLLALREARQRRPDLRGVIVGRAHGAAGRACRQAVQSLAATLGLEHTVAFVTDADDALPWLAAADVVVSAALNEPFGRTVVEALALGKPVVAVDSGGPAETLAGCAAGRLVSPTPTALAEGLLAVAEPAHSRALAESACQHARRYGLGPMVEQTAALYGRVASQAAPPSRSGAGDARQPAGRTSALHVVFIAEPGAGGVRRHVRWLTEGLCRAGVRVDLILSPIRTEPGFEDDLRAYAQLGCRVALVPMARGLSPGRDRAACRAIAERLAEWRPDVVHTHATKAGLLGRLAVRRHPGPVVVHSPHAFFFEEFADPVRRCLGIRLERWLCRHTTHYVLVGTGERRTARDLCGLPADRLTVVPNGLPAEVLTGFLQRDAARRELRIPATESAIGCVGRLAPQKGQDWLLRAAARAGFAQRPDARLVLVGSGPAEAGLRRLAADLGLAERVHWAGFVPEAWRCLRAFDTVVLPSRYEGLSYALLEALAAGVRLVVSDIPANLPDPNLRTLVWTVPVDDVDALAAALRNELAAADQPTPPAGSAARAAVAARFRLDAQVQQLLDLYARLVPGPRAAPATPQT